MSSNLERTDFSAKLNQLCQFLELTPEEFAYQIVKRFDDFRYLGGLYIPSITADDIISWMEDEYTDPRISEVTYIAGATGASIAELANNDTLLSLPEMTCIGIPCSESWNLEHPSDTLHKIYDIALEGGARLHRFTQGGGVPYSAIYVDEKEMKNGSRIQELIMVDSWNEIMQLIQQES